MKKIKIFTLAIFGALFLTAGLYSCNNDESDNARQENTEQKSLKSATVPSNLKVGKIENGRVIPYFDTETFKEHFLEYDFLEEIESVEVAEHYLTIIGKDKKDFSLVAYEFELANIDSELVIISADNPYEIKGKTHKCHGYTCTMCDFKKDKQGRTIGCKCKDDSDRICNHSVTISDPDHLDNAAKWATIGGAVVAVVVLILSL